MINRFSNKIPHNIQELKQLLLSYYRIENKKTFFTPPHPRNIGLSEIGIDEQKMKKALARIRRAKKNNEKIIVFGDYDADGICATAILWRILYQLEFNAKPFIPDRIKHGYGLTKAAIDDLLEEDQSIKLIITVDNGIVAHEAINYAQKRGLTVIVTDHHHQDEQPQTAFSIIHTTQLCGATVAWMLAKSLVGNKNKQLIDAQLDLCAIATISDQVQLRGWNRAFAFHGIIALRKTNRVGLMSLLKASGHNNKIISSETIGFRIGPRINAMGRIAHGMDALRLLCTSSTKRADELAKILDNKNSERQELTNTMYDQAFDQAIKQDKNSIIIVISSSFHEGVIGLIAGKLTEKFHKPAIAITGANETFKASARSIKEVNIVELISQAKSLLIDFGGHPMAAGFSFEKKNLLKVKRKLNYLAHQLIEKSLLQPSLNYITQLPADLLNNKSLALIKEFEPFGQGHEEPLFMFQPAELIQVRALGSQGKHLKMIVDLDGIKIDIIGWGMGEQAQSLPTGNHAYIIGKLQSNIWRSQERLQINAFAVQKL